jgi:hypothetical protein
VPRVLQVPRVPGVPRVQVSPELAGDSSRAKADAERTGELASPSLGEVKERRRV